MNSSKQKLAGPGISVWWGMERRNGGEFELKRSIARWLMEGAKLSNCNREGVKGWGVESARPNNWFSARHVPSRKHEPRFTNVVHCYAFEKYQLSTPSTARKRATLPFVIQTPLGRLIGTLFSFLVRLLQNFTPLLLRFRSGLGLCPTSFSTFIFIFDLGLRQSGSDLTTVLTFLSVERYRDRGVSSFNRRIPHPE